MTWPLGQVEKWCVRKTRFLLSYTYTNSSLLMVTKSFLHQKSVKRIHFFFVPQPQHHCVFCPSGHPTLDCFYACRLFLFLEFPIFDCHHHWTHANRPFPNRVCYNPSNENLTPVHKKQMKQKTRLIEIYNMTRSWKLGWDVPRQILHWWFVKHF